jgi:hypothetical protein
MAKHDVDPVLRQLVRAVNESGQAAVPVTVSLQGTTLTGMLIAQNRYFSDLVEANPLMSALERPPACWARSTPRRRKPSLTITCTCGRPEPAVTAVLPKDSGASAWRPSTGGLCAPPPRPPRRRTRDRSRACSAPRNDP